MIKQKIEWLVRFFTFDVWRIQTSRLPKNRSILLNQLRLFLLAVRGFAEDKCILRASALTFYTLLSIVPVVAMGFGISKGFGLDKMLERQITEKFAAQQEVMNLVLDFANRMLENTKGGVVAGVGVLVLFWTVIKLLSNIETSLNDIWGIKENRPFFRKLSDYLSIMLVCPILVILASSVTVFATVKLQNLAGGLHLLGMGPALLSLVTKLLSLLAIWLLFTFVYLFLPNTRVRIGSGLFAGMVAGTLFQVVQWGFVAGQVYLTKSNAVYGSFAALPMFLLWLQLSWLILLFGAEISFAHQNVETYEFEPDALRASNNFRRSLSLAVLNLIFRRLEEGGAPLSAPELSKMLEVPVRLVRLVLFDCVKGSLLYEVKGKTERSHTYIPAVNIEKVSLSTVLEKLDSSGCEDIPLAATPAVAKIRAFQEKQLVCQRQNSENALVKEI